MEGRRQKNCAPFIYVSPPSPPIPQIKEGTARRGAAKGMNVIDHREWAMAIYSPKTMYVNASYKEWLEEEGGQSRKESNEYKKVLGDNWETVKKRKKELAIWEKKAKDHDQQQPNVRGIIIDQLLCNRCTSFEGLAAATSHWCDDATVERWMKSFDSYGMYRKEIKPGLTPQNRVRVYSPLPSTLPSVLPCSLPLPLPSITAILPPFLPSFLSTFLPSSLLVRLSKWNFPSSWSKRTGTTHRNQDKKRSSFTQTRSG